MTQPRTRGQLGTLASCLQTPSSDWQEIRDKGKGMTEMSRSGGSRWILRLLSLQNKETTHPRLLSELKAKGGGHLPWLSLPCKEVRINDRF